MKPPFLKSLRLDGFLSFAPGSEAIELQGLNVLIGPNGSGKSNVIEAVELLKALPVDFAAAVRMGGGAEGFLWKGGKGLQPATIEASLNIISVNTTANYSIEFAADSHKIHILNEKIQQYFSGALENSDKFERNKMIRGLLTPQPQIEDSVLSYKSNFQNGHSLLMLRVFLPKIQTFREWTFGRSSVVRRAQPTDIPNDALLFDSSNLPLIINKIENHGNWARFNQVLKRFFPRFQKITTSTANGTIQFYLWETGFSTPIAPTRMSDGTLRFIALLATLLTPEPPPLICIEEPELGMHPDVMSIMAELLVEASERMQIIVTTHSDALLSALSPYPEAILTCERLAGSTHIRRLNKEGLFEWLKEYTLGDLWRTGHLGANP